MLRLFMLIVASALAMAVHAESTITYQGQLHHDGQPYEGNPGMEFRLFGSLNGSDQVGDAEVFSAVTIEGGLFQVELDFGEGAFDGSQRYLEIMIAGDTLVPRQRITGSPWSHQALGVAAGSVGSDQIATGAVGSNQIASSAVGTDELQSDSLSIGSGTGLQGGGETPLGGSTTISIADAGVGAAQIAPGAVGVNQVDSDQLQLRITGTCAPGTTLVGVNADGSVVCESLPFGVAYVLESEGEVGLHNDIAIRDNGLPVVSYSDRTAGALKVYDCDNVVCSSGTVRTLYSDSNINMGHFSSIAIRDNGRPIISYFGSNRSDLKVFDCDNAQCSSGAVHTLDDDDIVGMWTSIAIRNNGLPIISYFDYINSDLKVYDCDDVGCASGTERTLNSGGIVGEYSAIAIRDDGLPIISYRDSGNNSLMAYACTDVSCSSGIARTLDSDGDVGKFTSIAIRDNGLPIISYRDSGRGRPKVYLCGDAGCSSGNDRDIDWFGDAGRYSSIAIRDNGLPIISYYNSTDGNLMIRNCKNVTCSSWGEPPTRVLDRGDDVGRYTSIAIRDDGLPIISYVDYRNYDLKIFSCGDPSCSQ
ncbi:hypothetical protein IC757_12295 [Wenzhouxiangella sp. AB-CW3]|uniref:hypothetical protein n=1 Tax=Wenzhouxiangella sp. AB-CW3 TaxID=2771012 RepID=UPI00168AE8C7|nr:hypothetical protein [Wenzhouxiangella sp. AB-CW3]QOC21809.1 hypothetical protein IC757_12295 [Wenzhouxiangella sp. AB-CW3]